MTQSIIYPRTHANKGHRYRMVSLSQAPYSMTIALKTLRFHPTWKGNTCLSHQCYLQKAQKNPTSGLIGLSFFSEEGSQKMFHPNTLGEKGLWGRLGIWEEQSGTKDSVSPLALDSLFSIMHGSASLNWHRIAQHMNWETKTLCWLSPDTVKPLSSQLIAKSALYSKGGSLGATHKTCKWVRAEHKKEIVSPVSPQETLKCN